MPIVAQGRSVAIVGAGIAGAAAARRLHEGGWQVVLIDKGRSVGGRMATRRANQISVSITARNTSPPATRASPLRSRPGSLRASRQPWSETGWFVGHPAMAAPVRPLTNGLSVTTGCTVACLIRKEGTWQLEDATGALVANGRAFDALLVTCPAPQSAALLATAGIVLPGIDRVRYAACWALMLAHDGPAPFDAAALRFGEPEAPISWNARNSTKPGRGGDGTLVVHASPTWSRAHLEREPGEVSALLCAEFGRMPGLSAVDQGAIRHAAAHRWRYALVEQAVGTPCLWSLGDRLGAGGDPCLGGRGEAAYASGLALDEQVVE